MAQKHVKLRISGKVQGVWYRKSTQQEAQRLGLKGWVRNEPDGCVYAEAEGDEDTLNKLISWCKQGPPLAKVTGVEVSEGGLEGFEGFTVRH